MSTRPLLVAVAFAFTLWILLRLAVQLIDVIALVILAVIVAAAMMPIVRAVERLRVPRLGWSVPRAVVVISIYAIVGVALGTLAAVVISRVGDYAREIATSAPDIAAAVVNRLNEIAASVGLGGVVPSGDEALAVVRRALSGVPGAIPDIVRAVIDAFFKLFVVLVLAVFLVLEQGRVEQFVLGLVPPRHRARAGRVLGKMGDRLSAFVLGQGAMALIVGALAAVLSLVLGLPYPLVIGAITAVLDPVPMMGPATMSVPVFFLGLADSPLTGIIGAVGMLAISQFETSVLSPFIQSKAVQLSPVLIVIAVPAGAVLYGVLGAIMAIPVTAALSVLFADVVKPWLRTLPAWSGR